MSNLISNPFKATTSDGDFVSKSPTQDLSLSQDVPMLPINYVG